MNNFLNKIKLKINNRTLESQKEINGSRNLLIFLAGSLGIASVLVIASLILYTSDGTIQLDLSRPVLQEAREAQKKAKKEEEERKVVFRIKIWQILKGFIRNQERKFTQMNLVKIP